MSENTVKHEHKQCGGKNIEKMEEIGKTMPVEEEIYDVAELRVLNQARLVKYRREGKTVYYSVSDEHVAVILNMGIEHISE